MKKPAKTKKVKPIEVDTTWSKTNLYSLIILAIAAIFAQTRIVSTDIKLVYSLCLVIASGVGRYGTILASRVDPRWDDIRYIGYRHWIYIIMFLFGVGGLIFP